jgi:serine phosphatase RsbU (regulator of sigma subunit)
MEEKHLRNASLLYGVLDLSESKLRFMNAGMAYPIIVRDNVSRYLRFGKRSLGQNVSEERVVAVALRPGDLFVLLSDGIVNVRNSTGMQLGLKKVMDFLEKNFTAADDIIESLYKFTNDFSGTVGIREDISIIILRVS